jgi:hypothetical protein
MERTNSERQRRQGWGFILAAALMLVVWVAFFQVELSVAIAALFMAQVGVATIASAR